MLQDVISTKSCMPPPSLDGRAFVVARSGTESTSPLQGLLRWKPRRVLAGPMSSAYYVSERFLEESASRKHKDRRRTTTALYNSLALRWNEYIRKNNNTTNKTPFPRFKRKARTPSHPTPPRRARCLVLRAAVLIRDGLIKLRDKK